MISGLIFTSETIYTNLKLLETREFPSKAKVFEYLNIHPFIFMFSAVYTFVILYNIPKSMTMLHNLKSNVHISIVLETKTKFNGDY